MFFKKQNAQSFFSEDQKKTIQESIGLAELNTSGEIRVHVDATCALKNPTDQAVLVFEKLGMHQTELRNGILFYLAVSDKKFAILGDEGINTNVPKGFWDEIRNQMTDCFKRDEFAEGLTKGIQLAGEQLKTFFPLQDNDTNELSNDLSFGTDEN